MTTFNIINTVIAMILLVKWAVKIENSKVKMNEVSKASKGELLTNEI